MATQNIKSSNLHTESREQSVRLSNENGAKTDKTTLSYRVEEPRDKSGKLIIRKEENAVLINALEKQSLQLLQIALHPPFHRKVTNTH